MRTAHAELSLEEVADSLPGTGEVMASVGHCFAMAAHACREGAWELGAYYLRRTRSLLRGLALTRPKYGVQLGDYDRVHLEGLYRAVLDRDLAAFAERYQAATDAANAYHVDTGHAYIRWSCPAEPPEKGLDLSGRG